MTNTSASNKREAESVKSMMRFVNLALRANLSPVDLERLLLIAYC